MSINIRENLEFQKRYINDIYIKYVKCNLKTDDNGSYEKYERPLYITILVKEEDFNEVVSGISNYENILQDKQNIKKVIFEKYNYDTKIDDIDYAKIKVYCSMPYIFKGLNLVATKNITYESDFLSNSIIIYNDRKLGLQEKRIIKNIETINVSDMAELIDLLSNYESVYNIKHEINKGHEINDKNDLYELFKDQSFMYDKYTDDLKLSDLSESGTKLLMSVNEMVNIISDHYLTSLEMKFVNLLGIYNKFNESVDEKQFCRNYIAVDYYMKLKKETMKSSEFIKYIQKQSRLIYDNQFHMEKERILLSLQNNLLKKQIEEMKKLNELIIKKWEEMNI